MAFNAEELSGLSQNLIAEAERHGTRLRLLGGLAFYISSPTAARLPGLQREYKDLDFAVDKKGARALGEIFSSQGWEPDRHFNALHGRTRLLFYYQKTLQADIFIGEFEQCHKLDLDSRLGLSSPTLPLADLLLTKLQVRQINEKDARDVYTLLLGHDLASDGAPGYIDLGFITHLTSSDWGWYTTIHDNLDTLDQNLPAGLAEADRQRIQSRLGSLRSAMEAAPKSLRWQMRNQVGRRVPWYDEPEEVLR